MRWLASLAFGALGACNRIFDVGGANIILSDARPYDGLVDAPFHCPATGTPLQFSPVFRQVIQQNCRDYSTSTTTGMATASCTDDDGVTFNIYQGLIDQPLTLVSGTPPVTPSLFEVSRPRLSPDGDQLFIQTLDFTTFDATHGVYAPNADGSWSYVADLPVGEYGSVSVPSRKPDRHLLYFDGTPVVSEWSDQGIGAWSQLQTLDLGTNVRQVWLSPDGLRMLASVDSALSGTVTVLYADRATIDMPFGAPTTSSLASTSDEFVSEDCSRVYLSSIEMIFYANQL